MFSKQTKFKKMEMIKNNIQSNSLSLLDEEINELFHRYRDAKEERLDKEKYSKEIVKRLNVLYKEDSKPDFQQLKLIAQNKNKEKHILSLSKIKNLLETANNEKQSIVNQKKILTSSIKEKRDQILQNWKENIYKKNYCLFSKIKEDSETQYSIMMIQKTKEENKKKCLWESIQQMRASSVKQLFEYKYLRRVNQKGELLKKLNKEKKLIEKYDQCVAICEDKRKQSKYQLNN